MASRRDQLNAYTFARKRMVAAFLQPSAAGSEEGAPRPLRAVVPSIAVGALLLAAFGAWGLIKPTAPLGWDAPGANVLVGSESTTRYIVWSNGKKQKPLLHPVLNLASAKLLLNPDKFSVLKVDESVLDSGKIQPGATLGIPYAPDRMPAPGDAGTPKPWAVCEQPRGGGAPDTAEPQKAAFMFGASERGKVDGAGKLGAGKALYVESGQDRYLVDPGGTAHRLVSSGSNDMVKLALFGSSSPQKVTPDWLATLNQGSTIAVPDIPGFGASAGMPAIGAEANRIGMVVRIGDSSDRYVVLQGKIERISMLMSKLLMYAPAAKDMYGASGFTPRHIEPQALSETPSETFDDGKTDWPAQVPVQANKGADTTSCSVYRGVIDSDTKKPKLSMWIGHAFPKKALNNGGTSAYVTPGSGLLFRQLMGSTSGGGGGIYLVTDTGLRYSVPNDATADTDNGKKSKNAQMLLGYGQVQPVDVPRAWAAFLPTGPVLSPLAAAQEQES